MLESGEGVDSEGSDGEVGNHHRLEFGARVKD
jgi:hypothetical protein